MDVEIALAIAEKSIFEKTGQQLTTLQTQVFRGAWFDQTYAEIAKNCRCSDTHVKKVGTTLWELISQGIERDVNKKTFRAALERYPNSKLNPVSINAFTSIPSGVIQAKIPDREFQYPEASVELSSHFYIERPPVEFQCYRAVLQPGSLLRIKATAQMGKTSLLNRILYYAQQQGYHTVSLNLKLVDNKTLQDLDRFLQWLCVCITRKLNLPLKLTEYWNEILGSKTSCKDYFEQYLLPQLNHPLVLAFDDVDAIFPYPEMTTDFLVLLRSWHEEAKYNRVWQNLNLVLSYFPETDLLINFNLSLFNVGIPIELPEFNEEQVITLAYRHGLDWNTAQIQQLMDLVGGHPHLVRIGLYHIAYYQMPLEKLLYLAPTNTGPYSDYLRRYLSTLIQQPKLVATLQAVLNATTIPFVCKELFQLNQMGLIRFQNNQVTIPYKLYLQYFSNHLLKSSPAKLLQN